MFISKRAQEDLRELFPIAMFGGIKGEGLAWHIKEYTPSSIQVTTDLVASAEPPPFASFSIYKGNSGCYNVVFVWSKAFPKVYSDFLLNKPGHGPYNVYNKSFPSFEILKSGMFNNKQSNISAIEEAIATLALATEQREEAHGLFGLAKIFPRHLFSRWNVHDYKPNYIQAGLDLDKKHWGLRAVSIINSNGKQVVSAEIYSIPNVFKPVPMTGTKAENRDPSDPVFDKIREIIEAVNNKAIKAILPKKQESIDFSLSKYAGFTWTKPKFEEEKGEFSRVALEENVSYDSLKRSFKHGTMRPLDRKVWEHLENTDSLPVRSLEDAIALAKNYSRDYTRLQQAFENQKSLPAPIVLEFNNGAITLVAGNTRLAFAKAYHVKPYVYWIKETELFD